MRNAKDAIDILDARRLAYREVDAVRPQTVDQLGQRPHGAEDAEDGEEDVPGDQLAAKLEPWPRAHVPLSEPDHRKVDGCSKKEENRAIMAAGDAEYAVGLRCIFPLDENSFYMAA